MPMSVYLILFALLLDVTSAADDPKLPTSNSMITVEKITPAEYDALISSGQFQLIKQDSGLYRVDLTPVPTRGVPCAVAFNRWFNQYDDSFQSAANSQCKSIRGAWRNNRCCVLFVVNPHIPPCSQRLQYEYVEQITIPGYLSSDATPVGK
ncbi:unnamed protein product [Adineta steineri]|uniref:Secreted protein n=1 Tax=Adineta steineri TaxID=433720 RepID=A0A816FXF4_9BILA|nr:unnamed protein product [Adineta steineri]CAF1667373.1 unnamed protein product [Adineta steineri]